jgi:hypothetical protein
MTVSTRTISSSMAAVVIALGVALIGPALSGVPTGSDGQFVVAENQAADCAIRPALCSDRPTRQQRILIARDMRTQPTVMAQTETNPAM